MTKEMYAAYKKARRGSLHFRLLEGNGYACEPGGTSVPGTIATVRFDEPLLSEEEFPEYLASQQRCLEQGISLSIWDFRGFKPHA